MKRPKTYGNLCVDCKNWSKDFCMRGPWCRLHGAKGAYHDKCSDFDERDDKAYLSRKSRSSLTDALSSIVFDYDDDVLHSTATDDHDRIERLELDLASIKEEFNALKEFSITENEFLNKNTDRKFEVLSDKIRISGQTAIFALIVSTALLVAALVYVLCVFFA